MQKRANSRTKIKRKSHPKENRRKREYFGYSRPSRRDQCQAGARRGWGTCCYLFGFFFPNYLLRKKGLIFFSSGAVLFRQNGRNKRRGAYKKEAKIRVTRAFIPHTYKERKRWLKVGRMGDGVNRASPGNPQDRPTARHAGEEGKDEKWGMMKRKNTRRKIREEIGD